MRVYATIQNVFNNCWRKQFSLHFFSFSRFLLSFSSSPHFSSQTDNSVKLFYFSVSQIKTVKQKPVQNLNKFYDFHQELEKQKNNKRRIFIVPLILRSSFALPPLLLHRLSIDCPSILHRNDGLTMEMRWRCDGVSSNEERKIPYST